MKIILGNNTSKVNELSVFYNENRTKTVEEILNASIDNNNILTFNGKEICVSDLYTHKKLSGCHNFKANLGISEVYPDFMSNVYLLSVDLQKALLSLLNDIQIKYKYDYGTNLNISAYEPLQTSGGQRYYREGNKNICPLDFYINVSSCVGSKTVYEFIDTLKDYNASLLGNNNSLPSESIIISRWEHLKNGKNEVKNPQKNSSTLYDKMLNILALPIETDCFEADLSMVNKIIANI